MKRRETLKFAAMTTENDLSARSEQILASIVRAYIESGEPIASHQISRLRRYKLSPASVRNTMADLMVEGYLQQPHASAGRVPTAKAFQAYVRRLQSKRVQSSELGRIRVELSDAGTVEERLERTTHLLTEMTNSIGITAGIPTERQTLDQVELLGLSDHRVLMIVVTRDRLVRQKVVALDEPVSQPELDSIRNFINTEFSGWTISAVHNELRKRLERVNADYDRMLKRLTALYAKGLLAIDLAPELHLGGAANLLRFQFQLTRERLSDIFHALEEKKKILQLLERFLDQQPSGEVGVQVGLGEEHPGLKELSLIGIAVNTPGGMTARLAVLGPMRMDYDRAVSVVLHVGRAFGSMPS
jgi:heat-inducible transcriptional repressor